MPPIFFLITLLCLMILWIMGVYISVKMNERNQPPAPKIERQMPASSDKTLRFSSLKKKKLKVYVSKIPQKCTHLNDFSFYSVASPNLPKTPPENLPPPPKPDPVDIPRQKLQFLRRFRRQDFEEDVSGDFDTLKHERLPEKLSENIQKSLEATHSISEEDTMGMETPTSDEIIQIKQFALGHKNQIASSLTEYLLLLKDVSTQVSPENQDEAIQASPSLHDISLQAHISQHDQGIQYDISAHTPLKSLLRDESVQAIQSMQDVSLQNNPSRISKGVGSHIFCSSKEVQAHQEFQDESIQVLANFQSPSSHAMSEEDLSSHSLKSSVKSENIIDKIPLSESVWALDEEEPYQKQHMLKKATVDLNEISLVESIYLEQEISFVEESILLSEVEIKDKDEKLEDESLKPLTSLKKPNKDSDSFEIVSPTISPQKNLPSHSSWDLLEDDEK